MTVNLWNWPSAIFGGPVQANLRDSRNGDHAGLWEKCQENGWLGSILDYVIDSVAPSPWFDTIGSSAHLHHRASPHRRPLYTPEQRQRRDSTRWTLIQGILAPIQFFVFLVSLALVVNYLMSGNGYQIAAVSVVIKTFVLYAIMITGAIWENKVFGKYLFAPAFFWEDAVSMLVIALHTAYLLAMLSDWGTPADRMVLALMAYVTYAVNATQFILKLRTARLEAPVGHAIGDAR